MKVLLDECVPWPIHRLLVGHECRTAQQKGWGGIKNGQLLQLAEAEFELFITADQNLRYQQNLAGRRDFGTFHKQAAPYQGGGGFDSRGD